MLHKSNISSLSVIAGLLGVSMIRKRKISSKNESHDSIMDVTVRFKVEYTLHNMAGDFEYNKKDYEDILFEESFFEAYKGYLDINNMIYLNPSDYNGLDGEDSATIIEQYLEIVSGHPDMNYRFLDRLDYRLEDVDIEGLNDFRQSSPKIVKVEIVENNGETYAEISYSYNLVQFYAFMSRYSNIKEGIQEEFAGFENDMVNLIGMYYVPTDIDVIIDGQELEPDISDIGFTVISTDIKVNTDSLSKRDKAALVKFLGNSELRKF